MQNSEKVLLWMLRASEKTPTSGFLKTLSESPDLFDFEKADKNNHYYEIIKRSYEEANKCGYRIVTYIDREYPKALKQISMPPPQLYIRGDIEALSHGLYAGFVGARICDDYGLKMASQIASEVCQTGVGIVSGGAKGVDAASHRGALLAKGRTIAVLGSGVDVLYPDVNKSLFEKIINNGGCVISEYHLGQQPDRRNFPRRNRIIAALSDVLAVIRAGARSGSLITASKALDMGKTIFAMPGNIDNSLSIGTNELINDGARMLLSSMDIIDELMERNPDFFKRDNTFVPQETEPKKEPLKENIPKKTVELSPSGKSVPGVSDSENEVLMLISKGITKASEMEEKISFDASRLPGVLSMLELKGLILKGLDKKYKLRNGGKC